MKSVLLIFSFLLSLSLLAYSQNRVTDTSATCIAFWKNKETKVYQIKHSKEKLESGNQKSLAEGFYEAHLRVIDSTEAGFTIEWIYKNFKSSLENEHALNSLNAIMEGLKIVYKTDDVGMFTELINWEEVRDFSFSNYRKALAEKAQNKEFVAALNQLKSIFQTKENIETLLIKEVQMFHAPFGVEYISSGTSVETQLPNVTGGAPFPATITLKLDKVTSNEAIVSINQTIDKGKAGPIIATLLKKLSNSPMENEAEINKQIKDLEISDINQFTYILQSGWLTRIFFKRTSNIGKLKQVEIYEITEKK